MPLTIVTGPANAEKARVVLDGYRAALARGEQPILVVPTFADVERYRGELASSGIVFGAQIVRFGWLVDEIARRESLTVAPEDVDKEVERFAERSGRTPAAVRAQLEKDGGIARLTAGLKREKTVDLAM